MNVLNVLNVLKERGETSCLVYLERATGVRIVNERQQQTL